MWAELVNLNTIHWYCDGPEPTLAAIKYEKRTRQRKSISIHIQFDCFSVNLPVFFSEMEDAKRRAAIRNQAAKRKEMDEGAMGTGLSRPSAKKRLLLKGDRAPKKQKVSTEPVIGLMAEGNKTVTPAKHGGGKGLMVPPLGS